MYQVENSSDLLQHKRVHRRSRLNWMRVGRTVFLLGITSLLTDIAAEMVSTTLPLYLLVTLHFSPLQMGFIDGLYQGAAVLVKMISGLLSDRWRRPKEVAASGYAFSALCKLGFLVVGSSWMGLSSVVLLDRIGKGIRTAPRDAMIAASSTADQWATAFGVHRALDTAGAMLGPLLAVIVLMLAPDAYDAVFVVSLCIAVIGLAVIILFVHNPISRVDAPAQAVSLQAVGRLLMQPDFRVLVIIGSGLALATVSDSLIYLTLQRRLTISSMTFPLLYVITALIYMLFAIPVGHLADEVGRKRIFIIGYGLLAAVYGLLLLPKMNHAIAVSLLLLLGLYYAATDGVLMALASRVLPEHLRATGLAVLTTGTGLARLCASTLYGTLWSWYGAERALLLFTSGLLIFIVVTVAIVRRIDRKGLSMSPTPKRNLRPLIFVIITCVCVLFSLVYVFGAAHKNSVLAVDPAVGSPLRAAAESPLHTEKISWRETLQQQPHIVRINQNNPSDLGKAEIAAIAAGKNAKFVTNLQCERVHYAANQGICLTRKIKHTTANTTATLFGPDFQPQFTFTTPGIPSRARVAPDGRHAAFTVFVLGHSYADAQMSTATFLLDTATGAPIANLEEFAVWRADKLLQASDLNFWGVTFAHDSNFFYATLRTGGQTYLVHGDIQARKMTLLHASVECPSLSPDEKRVVFKKLISRANWRLTTLDLTTFTETPLAETNSVDDQAEWLDNNHVLYSMPEPNAPPWMNVMIVPADGSGQHQIFAQGASSPAVVP